MRNDFRPETRSLFKTLKFWGFTPYSVNNGEETVKASDVSITEFLEETVATDEALVRFDYINGKRYSVYLVFGNCPGELVCDSSDFEPLNEATDAHSEKWENRKQSGFDSLIDETLESDWFYFRKGGVADVEDVFSDLFFPWVKGFMYYSALVCSCKNEKELMAQLHEDYDELYANWQE